MQQEKIRIKWIYKIKRIRNRGINNLKCIVWEQRRLGKITQLITKGTTPLDKTGQGEVNFIEVENIDPISGKVNLCTKISIEEHEGYLKRSQLQANDILFSIAGTLGRVCDYRRYITSKY